MSPPTVLRLAFGALASVAVAAPVLARHGGPAVQRGTSASLKSCINTTFTNNWTPYDDHTILVRSGSQSFKVTTNRCSGLVSPLPRIDTVLKGGSSICSPHDVDLYVSSGGMTRIPCFVQSIQPLTQDETRAMEAAGRKKH